jgi:hypothetical protein
VVSPLPAGIATGVWIHRREGLKGKHRWNGLLIPAATAMVLLGMCDSATTDTFGVQIAAGVADHHVHKLENASIKEPNPGINFSQLLYICSTTSGLRSKQDEVRGCSVA